MVRIALIAAGLALAASGPGQTQEQTSMDQQGKAANEAGRAALATFKKLLASQDAGALGFESRDEAGRAVLGESFAVFTIGLDPLKAYRPEAPVEALLTPSPDTVFPILVGGQVRSSVTVTRTERGYAPTAFGEAPLIRAIIAARPRMPGDFLVRVPALGLQFIGNRAGGRLMLTPVVVDLRLRLEPGQPVPIESVLKQLVPLAQAYNGLPI